MRVEHFLNESASRFAKKAAVVAAGREHSYADLARASDRVAAALVGRGVRRGDRVALFMGDTFEALVSAFAVLKAGAVATPVDGLADTASLARILGGTQPPAIVTDARRASIAAEAMETVRSIRIVLLCGGDRATAAGNCLAFEDIVGGIGPGPRIERAGPASDPALLIHAVGSDGAATVSTLSHSDVIAAATGTPDRPAPTFSAVLSHYGLCRVLTAIRAGATLVLESPSVFRRAAPAGWEGDAAVTAIAS